MLSPGSRDVSGQEIVPTMSSTTTMSVKVTLPVFCTMYCHVTGSPTFSVGPGAATTSMLLVFLVMVISGAAIKMDESEPIRIAELFCCSWVMNWLTGFPLAF